MKTTKHTYAIKSHGATKANDHSVTVEWPETLDGIVEAVGKERVYSMLVGFIAAHHVQSRIKSAFGAEKPSDEQKSLKNLVTGQLPLPGVEFIPAERGNGDDSVIKKLREADERRTSTALSKSTASGRRARRSTWACNGHTGQWEGNFPLPCSP